jgi:hypothetical protein
MTLELASDFTCLRMVGQCHTAADTVCRDLVSSGATRLRQI